MIGEMLLGLGVATACGAPVLLAIFFATQPSREQKQREKASAADLYSRMDRSGLDRPARSAGGSAGP